MNETDILQFLKGQVPLFRAFDQTQLQALLNGSRQASFEKNEAIIEFGETGRFLGVLLHGSVEVSIADEQGDRHELTRLGAGEIFGEMALMTGDKSTADVIARERCSALLIPQPVFATIIATQLSAVTCLSKTIMDRLTKSGGMEKRQQLAQAALKRSDDPYGFQLKTEWPMKLLVVNCGSSSLKYNLYDTADSSNNLSGSIERIGAGVMQHKIQSGGSVKESSIALGGHAEAFSALVHALRENGAGAPADISAVGHRVVHGGMKYGHAVLITEDVMADIEAASVFAPLHNPVNLLGIREAIKCFPNAPQVAVFDTAFHQNMPDYAQLYGLPFEYYEEKQIRRYGFHGTSHKYVALKVAEFLKRPYNELETIVCHLGNGASVCAVDHGRSVDTSMGFTPAEGLLMGTRSGDLDPAILVHLMRTEGLDAEGLDRLINKQGGLKGLSGLSNDMREVEAAAEKGDHRAMLALKTFSYRVRKYLGAYMAAMGGLDAIAFTGGIGQGSVGARSLACQGLEPMGVCIDEEKNRQARGFEQVCDISAEDSTVRVLVVPTDEQRMIARETLRVLERSYVNQILQEHTPMPVPVEVSAHHVHLSQAHVEALYGAGHQLTPKQELSQPGQFACEEQVTLIGPKGRVDRVRVLGPVRNETQVEISMTEQFKLGIHPPVRESGDLKDTPGLTLEGTQGSVAIDHGVICALRHIHMTPEDALHMGLKDKDVVKVRIEGDRELVFGDVLVRVRPDFRLSMHIDTDEANAAHISGDVIGHVEGIQSRR